MSVLIKGMEMPHSCIGCRFCEHGSINEWDLYCGINHKHIGNWDDKHINNGWRRPDCPLVEVPTPHGPLVDADALKATFCAECNHTITCEDCDIDYHIGRLAPTIIEAEEGEPHEQN